MSKRTINVDDVRKACQEMGDSLHDTYKLTKDLKAALASISAYGTAVSAVKAQLIYKKLTGSPEKIAFFEPAPPKAESKKRKKTIPIGKSA